MTAVDKRVVEMGFDNQQFESGVSTSVKSLDTLKKSLNLEDSAKGLNNLSAAGKKFSLDGIAEGVQSISNRFSTLGIIGMTILQNLTNAAIDLGKKLASNLLGLDSMKAGFGSYETKINAVKTVMSGTGETMDTVNKSIQDLNDYSDRTVYSFEDMTANISKFTNAGLKSKQAALAIQGISNVAAMSGANANEAARAMYNFGQALSSGMVRLIDWKSIENANMATMEFKTQLLEAGVAAGTLKKTTDGMYAVVGKETVTIGAATERFNDSLQEQWLTSKVLTNTLGDYASTETEIGKRANDAATQLKTFTQLTDNMQDAMKTGWTKTWELIFGNLDQATELFTFLGDKIGGLLSQSSNARNQLLSSWQAFGGRASLFTALKNVFNSLLAVMDNIKIAFQSIFPPMTGYQLASLTWALKTFTDKLVITKDMASDIRKVFRGIFSVFDLVGMAVKFLAEWLFKLSGASKISGKGILKHAADIGNWVFELRNAIKYQGLLGETFKKFIPFIENLKSKFKTFLDTVGPIFAKIKDFFTNTFSNIEVDTSGVDNFMDRLKLRLEPLSKLAEFVGKIVGGIWNLLKKLGPPLAKLGKLVGDALKELGSAIGKALETMDFNAVFDVLNEGLIAALLLAMRNFVGKGSGAFDGISELLEGVGDSLQAWQTNLKAKTILTIAAAIGILAISLIALSLVNSAKLAASMAAITVMFGELMGSMAVFTKIGGGKNLTLLAGQLLALSLALVILSTAVAILAKLDPEELGHGLMGIGALLAELALFMKINTLGKQGAVKAAGLLTLAVALNIMALAVKQFASMDQKALTQGLIALGAVLGELAAFIKLSGNAKGFLGTAIGLGILSTAMLIFAVAVGKMAQLSWEEIARGLATMGGSLAIITAAMRLMPNNVIFTGIGLLAVAGALYILTKALSAMGKMTLKQIGKGLAVLAGSLGILALGMYAMTGALPGAAALLIIAGALTLFVPALKALGNMSIKEIALGLGSLVAVFAILGLAGLILGPLVPIIFALSAALVLFGIASLAVGAGMLAFSAGLAALAVSGTAGAAALVVLVSTLLGLIPLIIVKIVEGILQFVTLIANSAGTIAAAFTTVALALLQVVIDLAPKLFETFKVILLGLIGVIRDVIPAFVDAMLFLVTSLLASLAESIPQWVDSGIEILRALLKGIADTVGEVVQGAFDIVIAFLDAVAEKFPELVQAGWDMVISIVDGLADGVEENLPKLIASATRLANAIIDGLVDGMAAGVKKVVEGAANLGKQALEALGIKIDANSPSKEFGKLGKWSAVGYANGLVEFTHKAVRAGKDLGKKTISGLSDTVDKIANILDDNLDISPTIRPVLDLSDVLSGTDRLNKVMDQASSKLDISATSDKLSRVRNGMNSGAEYGKVSATPDAKLGSVSFTQINNSPKALSRIDIYRDTKNLIKPMKGLVPNT